MVSRLEFIRKRENEFVEVIYEFNRIRKNMGLNLIAPNAEAIAQYLKRNRFNHTNWLAAIAATHNRKRTGVMYFINTEIAREKAKADKKLKRLAEQARLQAHIDLMRGQNLATIKPQPNIQTSVELGWVYVIVHPSFPGWLKIGSTLNVEDRLAMFQTHAPDAAYKIVFKQATSNRKQLEHLAHEHFAQDRGKGEWFRSNLSDVKKFLQNTKNIVDV